MKNNKTKNKVIITFMTMMIALSLISCTKNASADNAKNDSPEDEVYEEQMADSKREEAVLKKENEKTEGVTDSKKDEQDNIYLFSSDNDLSDEEKELYYGEGNLIDRINNYLGEEQGNVGFLYYDLVTGEQISFNEDKQFYAASLYKLGMNILCYDKANRGEVSLDETVTIQYYGDESDNEYLNYDAYTDPTSLQTLLDQTIINSDNTAASMIYHYLGGWNSFRSQYISFFDMQDQYWSNDTTINNEFKILKYLYDNKEQYSHLIETMKNTSFHDRIDKYIPQDIVAHKIGDLDTAANDEAIVFTDKPYIIILLTDNVGYSYETIADISKAVYIYNLTN